MILAPPSELTGSAARTSAADSVSMPDRKAAQASRLYVTCGSEPICQVSNGSSAVQAQETTSSIARQLVRDDEIIILMIRPSILFVLLPTIGMLLAILAITMALAFLAAKFPQVVGWSETSAFALGVILIVLRLGWQFLDWATRVYVLTDRRVIRRMGVLRVSVFEASLSNIQHTSVFVRFRERVFGLGSIGFATSGSDVFDAFWVMVRNPFVVHATVVRAIERYGRRGGSS